MYRIKQHQMATESQILTKTENPTTINQGTSQTITKIVIAETIKTVTDVKMLPPLMMR